MQTKNTGFRKQKKFTAVNLKSELGGGKAFSQILDGKKGSAQTSHLLLSTSLTGTASHTATQTQ